MDKKKQIEEMAKDFNYQCKTPCHQNDCYTRCGTYKVCEMFYNAGYRKINENEIVISKEEYEGLKSQRYIIINKQVKSGENVVNLPYYPVPEYEIKHIPSEEEIRKETAREILDQIKFLVEERNSGNCDIEDLSVDGTILEEILNEQAEKYGIDLGE